MYSKSSGFLGLLMLYGSSAAAQCLDANDQLQALRASAAIEWRVDDSARRQTLALALVDCLADPDPGVRDGFAIDALTRWARGGWLETATLLQLSDRLQAQLQAPADAAGFRQPFAALALAEVARVDRITPYLSPAQRQMLLVVAVAYMTDIRDRRGYDEGEGWRHGVAHGADLLMQLSLNPALTAPQLEQLLQAVAAQAVPDTAHFYIYGEGERLARPVLFAARRGLLPPAYWSAWFSALTNRAAPPAGPPTQLSLSRLHNLKALLWPLQATVATSSDAALNESLAPGLKAAIQQLP